MGERKLSDSDKKKIYEAVQRRGDQSRLAEEYGVDRSTISRAVQEIQDAKDKDQARADEREFSNARRKLPDDKLIEMGRSISAGLSDSQIARMYCVKEGAVRHLRRGGR